MKRTILSLRTVLHEEAREQLRASYPDDILEFRLIEPMTPMEATQMAKEAEAAVVYLNMEPMPMDGLRNGVRFVFLDANGKLVELEDVKVITKPFVP